MGDTGQSHFLPLLLGVVELFSASTVTSTSAPFLRLTSSPFSSVSEFSMRISWYRGSAPSIDISAFSGSLGLGDSMIFSTFPGQGHIRLFRHPFLLFQQPQPLQRTATLRFVAKPIEARQILHVYVSTAVEPGATPLRRAFQETSLRRHSRCAAA